MKRCTRETAISPTNGPFDQNFTT